jgi:hypothetical protein
MIPGIILLLPVGLLALALSHRLDTLPDWAGISIAAILVVGTNALLWYWVSRIKRELKGSD